MESVALHNFKAFARVELQLAPMTLLSGLNASGKSTVLQALAVLRQSHEDGTLAEDGLLLNGELIELGTGHDVLYEDYETGEGGPRIGVTVREAGLEYGWSGTYGYEQDLLPLADRPEHPVEQLSLFQRGFQYLHANRIVPAVHYPKSHRIAIRRGFLGVRGEHTVNYLRIHQDDPLARTPVLHPEERSPSLLDQVNAWMRELCPGVNLQADDLQDTDFVRLRFGFFGTAGIRSTNRYRPTNVGFGLTYTLPVVVACLTAQPGSLVMLENPEAHLHPRGQTMMGRLAALAASTGAQVLVETHSEHVLNATRLAVKDGDIPPSMVALHYFHRRDDGAISVTTPVIGRDGMISDWPEGFFDEWDRSLDRLLT